MSWRHAAALAPLLACATDPSQVTDGGPGGDDPSSADGAVDAPSAPPPRTPSDGGPPNLLFLLADDAGIDHIGAYDPVSTAPPTPTLDALAAEGVRFEQVWASPSCSPTRASLLTGKHPYRHDIGQWLATESSTFALDEALVTLPELLAEADPPYTSAIVGKWHLVGSQAQAPLTDPQRRGFTTHRGSMANPRVSFTVELGARAGYERWEKVVDGVPALSETYMTTDTVDEAVGLLGTLPEPWFLLVSFNAPHFPLHVPPAPLPGSWLDPDTASDADKFDAAVMALDAELARLLAAIHPDVRARTTIVFASDNGTPHEVIRPPLESNRSKLTMYEGGVRVPLIVAGAGVQAEPGSLVSALTSLVDLVPTFADLAGVPAEARVERDGSPLVLDGRSLLPWLADPSLGDGDRVLWSEQFAPAGPPPHGNQQWAVRDQRFKLAEQPVGRIQLFDLRGRPFDEGPDLLRSGLTDEAEAAMTRLEAERDARFRDAGYAP